MDITQIDTIEFKKRTISLLNNAYSRSSFKNQSKSKQKAIVQTLKTIKDLQDQAQSIIKKTSDQSTMKQNISKYKDLKDLEEYINKYEKGWLNGFCNSIFKSS